MTPEEILKKWKAENLISPGVVIDESSLIDLIKLVQAEQNAMDQAIIIGFGEAIRDQKDN